MFAKIFKSRDRMQVVVIEVISSCVLHDVIDNNPFSTLRCEPVFRVCLSIARPARQPHCFLITPHIRPANDFVRLTENFCSKSCAGTSAGSDFRASSRLNWISCCDKWRLVSINSIHHAKIESRTSSLRPRKIQSFSASDSNGILCRAVVLVPFICVGGW